MCRTEFEFVTVNESEFKIEIFYKHPSSFLNVILPNSKQVYIESLKLEY